jgi:hypothetical protein
MPRGAVVYTKVHELLNPYTGTWDEDLLRVLFNAVDVERILQIPINHQGFEDFIAWGETKHGRYMVKSGYYLQWKHQFGTSFSQLALPGGSATNLTWKVLWKLKIPSKVKIFMWRALHGIMPLKCILAIRHIGDSGACPVCDQGAEDVRHLSLFVQRRNLNNLIEEASQVDRSGSLILEHVLRLDSNILQGFESVKFKEVFSVTCCTYGGSEDVEHETKMGLL